LTKDAQTVTLVHILQVGIYLLVLVQPVVMDSMQQGVGMKLQSKGVPCAVKANNPRLGIQPIAKT